MKKIILAALVAAPIFFTACNEGAPRPEMKTNVDTLSYELGMSNTNGIEMYFSQNGIDSASINEFLKGVKDGALVGDNKKKLAYYAGIQIGVQLKTQMFPGIERNLFGQDSTKHLNLKNFLAGFYAGVKHDSIVVDSTTYKAENVGQDLQQRFMSIRKEMMEKTYGENKTKSEAFVAQKAQEGYKKLDGGVLYKVITEGKGALPKDGDVVAVQYEGKLANGKVFDASPEGKTVDMTVGHMVPGFNTALKNMPVGSKWEIILPYDQAYGEMEAGEIPPFSALVFTVQVEKIGSGAGK